MESHLPTLPREVIKDKTNNKVIKIINLKDNNMEGNNNNFKGNINSIKDNNNNSNSNFQDSNNNKVGKEDKMVHSCLQNSINDYQYYFRGIQGRQKSN